jgi:hypothetical protein
MSAGSRPMMHAFYKKSALSHESGDFLYKKMEQPGIYFSGCSVAGGGCVDIYFID